MRAYVVFLTRKTHSIESIACLRKNTTDKHLYACRTRRTARSSTTTASAWAWRAPGRWATATSHGRPSISVHTRPKLPECPGRGACPEVVLIALRGWQWTDCGACDV